MRHARSDYDPIQDPRPDGIPADELVFLLRAQDAAAADTVHFWANVTEANGGDSRLVAAARRWADAMEAQRLVYGGGKVADVPEGALRA